MLALIERSSPASRKGGINAAMIRSATRVTFSIVSISGRRIVNSSPPIRAKVSPSRTQPKPFGDRFQQLIADRMPERVVDLLEAVEIEEHQGDQVVVPVGLGDRQREMILQQERFGRPVNMS